MKTEFQKKLFAVTFVILTGILVFHAEAGAGDTNTRSKVEIKKASPQRINKNAVSPSSFTPDMPLSEAIDILRKTTVPPLNIVVLWRHLEAAGIYRETPIGIDGVSRVPLRTHLKLLLTSVSIGGTEKLGYVVDGGVIIISTQSSLPKKFKTRIYDISDLVSTPAGAGVMAQMGLPFALGALMPYGGGGYMRQGQNPYVNTGSR
ncbi:MAG: hypothetical protein JW715_09105 [Sedimentisphaerales bacterium]|nr:hypothetical protein [Sedimentisphaerales bacterium]